jgi:hypothetical protein
VGPRDSAREIYLNTQNCSGYDVLCSRRNPPETRLVRMAETTRPPTHTNYQNQHLFVSAARVVTVEMRFQSLFQNKESCILATIEMY